jgi:hypothetical protein
VFCAFIENLDSCKKDPGYKKFVCKMYKFQGITVHQNSPYNASMKRKTEEAAYESFVTCTEYTKQNGLLDTDGYKQFQCNTIDSPNIEQLMNQAKTNNVKYEPFCKFVFLVPMNLKKKNGNNFWKDAEAT